MAEQHPRFSAGDKVEWVEGGRLMNGTIVRVALSRVDRFYVVDIGKYASIKVYIDTMDATGKLVKQ